MITAGLSQFPADWDTVMYHLPLVVHWLHEGSLVAPDCPQWSVPGNNELVLLWFVAPFSGDFFYALANGPVVILFGWAVLELGHALHISPVLRNLGAVAALASYVVIKQSTTAGNDVAVAAFFLSGLAYAFRYRQTGRIPDMALGVTCLGLLVGIKYYALGYAAVLAVCGSALVGSRSGRRSMPFAAVLGVSGVLVFGGYWYVRNWVVGGTPLYPLGRTAAEDEFIGSYPGMWQTTFAGNGSAELGSLAYEAIGSMTGPCHLLAVLGLPVSLSWLVARGGVRLLGGTGGETEEVRLALFAVTVGALAVLLVTPFAVEDAPGTLNQLRWQYCPVRYGTCFMTAAILCLAVILDDLSRAFRGLGLAVDRSLWPTSLTTGASARPLVGPAFGAAIPVLTRLGSVYKSGITRVASRSPGSTQC